MKVKLYTPVVDPGDGSGWFTVNGATCRDRDEAISITMRHSVFKTYDGVKSKARIARIDEHEIWQD